MKKLLFVWLLVTQLALSISAGTLRIVDAASFSDDLASGSIISVFGENLTNTTASAPDPSNLPKTLGGVTLTVNGVASPLSYVSPTQVNAQIDPSVKPGDATVVLTSPTGSFTTNVTIEEAARPGVFSLSGTGSRDGAVLNAVTFKLGAFSVTTNGAPTYLAIFTTDVDLSTKPKVTIGGVDVPVLYAGDAPGFPGLQQINVQLPESLAGAGRVELTVTSNGKTSNVVEVVILPKKGEYAFASDAENQTRSREIASIASIPTTSLALVTDENDDVVRVIDVSLKKVIRTIALAEGAQPAAIAVNPPGTTGVVTLRKVGKVAIIDLTKFMVSSEVKVGEAPGAVAILGTTAFVVNQDSGTVSVVDLTTGKVVTDIKVGMGPRGIAVDAAGNRAYVVNQNSGSISIIDTTANTVVKTLDLGANSRPAAIQVIPSLGLAIVTEPSGGPGGKVMIVNLTSGATTPVDVNPDRSGGSSDVAVNGTTAYIANQAGGSVTVAPITVAKDGTITVTTTMVKAGLGVRALAIDTKDNLLLVTNEGTGKITLIDLTGNKVVGSIDAVRSERSAEKEEGDDHGDRQQAANVPTISSLNPTSGKAGSTFTLTIAGKNLTGTKDVIFSDPTAGKGGKGQHDDESDNPGADHGPMSYRDTGFTSSNIVVNADGTQVTVQVQIASGHAAGARLVQVLTQNGESTGDPSAANTFNVTQ